MQDIANELQKECLWQNKKRQLGVDTSALERSNELHWKSVGQHNAPQRVACTHSHLIFGGHHY